jgi:putative hydrolase of the HAD superfamily
VIRAVISDFGGVLTTPLIESFVAYQQQSGVAFEELGGAMMRVAQKRGDHPLYELERGEISEADFLAALEAELGGGVRLGSFRETYFANLHPNEAMIGYMRELRDRGLRMALLTNNVREWEPHWRAKLPDIDEIFEVVVDSAFVGMRKPDPEIYRLTVERIGDGVRAEECVFVDDNDVNVDAARQLRMVGVQFRDAEQARAEIEAALGGAPGGSG